MRMRSIRDFVIGAAGSLLGAGLIYALLLGLSDLLR